MKTSKNLILFALFSCILSFLTCKKVEKEMLVTTGSVTNILATTADVSGSVVDLGEGATEYGHCYSKSPNPKVTGTKTELGRPEKGGFTSALTGLEPDSKYYVKAYISKNTEVVYGDEINFTTGKLVVIPTITTVAITNISQTTATGGGNISSDGGASVTSRGICWSTSQNPTVSDSKTTDGTSTGLFNSSLTSLSPNTNYYVRAYATNSAGTAYGNQVSFSTLQNIVAPSISTTSISNITQTTAIGGGNISSDGGAAVTSRGMCWSTSQNPTISDSKSIDGTGTGSYTSNLTNLSPNTTYYVRAYATNSAGTSYGSQVNFSTLQNLVIPTLTTTAISSITPTTASGGGNITSDGGATVTVRGICWSTSQNPTISDSKTTDGTGVSSFTSALSSLSPNTTYYVRAYATNSVGTAYGSQVNFTTLLNIVVPTLTTSTISSISQTTAMGGGNISSDGGASVTARGVCWSSSPNPTTSDSKTTDGTGTSSFTSSLTSLTANTTYYVRAYATNSAGTAYGSQVNFTTLPIIAVPTLTTTTISSITQTTASGGGTITSDGGAEVTVRGVCWSTSVNPTTSDSKTTDGTGTGSFSSSLASLTANTTYYVRAYATNIVGTSYGNQVSFTSSATLPTVTTTSISAITQTTATGGGNITSDGGAPVTTRGVCWSTSPSPTISGSKTTDGTGTGSFTSSLTTLTANTTYYIRAYATNSAGTSYGAQVTFLTSPSVPTLTTTAISSIAQTTASGGGNITSDGGATISARGICWSTSPNPTTSDSKTTDGNGTGSFTSSLTGLLAATTYYVRAYATNSAGTAYGTQVSFKSQSQDEYVLANIMTGLKIVERIKSGTLTISVNLDQMVLSGYNSCVRIGDFVVYTKFATAIDRTDWAAESGTAFTGDRFPSALQIKFAWKSDGTVYMGAIGTDNEVLASLVEGYWQDGLLTNSNTLFEASALETELLNLKSSSLVTGFSSINDLTDLTFWVGLNKTIFNRFSKPIYIVFSCIALQGSPGTIEAWSNGTMWCPLSGTGTGTGQRNFNLAFTNATNAYFCAQAGNDNGNSSYIKLNGTVVAQMSKYWGNYFRRTATYPSSVEIGATNSWSGAMPYFRMAIVGDGITASGVTQTPTGGLSNNKAPIINVIPVY